MTKLQSRRERRVYRLELLCGLRASSEAPLSGMQAQAVSRV
jgi:hypothetical protein